MIDLNILRENFVLIKELLHKKDPHYDSEKLCILDKKIRTIRAEVELLRAQKNELAKQGRAGITDELRERSVLLSDQLKKQEHLLEEIEKDFKHHYLLCPNIVDDSVPQGTVESNSVLRIEGQKKEYHFQVKNHVQLGAALGWFDFDAAVQLGGANLALYKKDGVRLLYALAMFMLKHNNDHGFEYVLPSILVNEKTLEVTGNFPRFKDQAFAIPHDELYLTPTSEVNLTNMYRNHIFAAEDLPVRMTAFTSCFRREGGGYGASERGLIRMRQFEKVEIVSLCKPEDSWLEHERMLACAESIMQKLGLHYRVVLLAGQDTSFSSAKTYDLEVWCPGQNEYKEVSSISNCTDFQARRGLIRFKESVDGKTQLVHTLNASSLALPRLMVALMETYQREDGTITIPEVLKKEGLF